MKRPTKTDASTQARAEDVDEDGEHNPWDYKYSNGEFVLDPIELPEVEEEPSQLDRIEAQLAYTAMQSDTLIEDATETQLTYWHGMGLWSDEMVGAAYNKGKLSNEAYSRVTGNKEQVEVQNKGNEPSKQK